MITTYIDFKPHGPHAFPQHVEKKNNGRFVNGPAFKKWLAGLKAASCRGVYIIALRNKSEKPWYVGRTTDSTFKAECSTPNTRLRIHEAMVSSKGTPVIYFIELTSDEPEAGVAIDLLETEMIRWCFSLNADLLNNKKKQPKIQTRVHGVLRSRPGKPSSHALALRALLGEA